MKIALTRDWRDDEDDGPASAELSAILQGAIERADFNAGRDVLTLTYADGRQVTITLHQCRSHSCDETCMVLSNGLDV